MDIPKDLEQCYQILKETIPLNEQQIFIKTPRKDLIKYHHSLGQWIRNNWKLWGSDEPLADHFVSIGVVHPDDMSMCIIRHCWDRFQDDEAKIDREEVHIETKPW